MALRGLIKLFRLVGREAELHQEINGFLVFHSDEYVRIWGYYTVINGKEFSFYQYLVIKFDISATAKSEQK